MLLMLRMLLVTHQPHMGSLASHAAVESAELANAVASSKFLDAMHAFNEKRNKRAAMFFTIAKLTLPLWQPKPIAPVFD